MSPDLSHARIAVIGAGIGGLAAAWRLAHAGAAVTLFEAHPHVGGKMRSLPTAAGPVDAGPTVLTLRSVLDRLFADAGRAVEDHLSLTRLDTLARHYWRNGPSLDLMADPQDSLARVEAAFGARAADEVRAFSARAERLFAAFEGPMMHTAEPSSLALALAVMRAPRLLADMAPGRSLEQALRAQFTDPRLAQLFARYATYVGGDPARTPALLSLVWAAEARGVWSVAGGVAAVAQAIRDCAEADGVEIHAATPVHRIATHAGRVTGVETDTGHHPADVVLFAGDPAALSEGRLGTALRGTVRRAQIAPRSLSAHVASFAATPTGLDLAHHTVLFADDPRAEFDAIARGRVPDDATLYRCAPDHDRPGPQRFEIIRNAAPLPAQTHAQTEDSQTCRTTIFDRMAQFGLTMTDGPVTITGPAEFAAMFPGSGGSLYGRSPQGLTAALRRPRARTKVPGLYLCGGGTHPGAGVPMAALSGRHAAEAILSDLGSTSTSRRTATPGGTSTGSARTAHAR